MTDEAGAAPAAAEPLTPSQDNLGTAAQPEPTIDRSKETARASIDRAFAEMDNQDTDALQGNDRDEKGRFKAKDPQPVAPQTGEQQKGEAPSRFSGDAKAAWATVPDAVRSEVHRAFREMEGGLSEYQQLFEPLKPFYQLAQQHQTTVHDTLDRYVSLDMQLVAKEPEKKFAAIQEVLEHAGISPQEYAALIMGQKPDQTQAQSAAEIRQLKGEIADMRQLLGGLNSSLTQSRESEIEAMVTEFTRTHPRMSDAEFTKTVTRLINTQMADSLESAYEMAERLIAAPVPDTRASAASDAATTQKPSDQTRKGQLSVAGAPVSGSNPVKRKPAQSARESVDRAFAELGL
jgi:hypothetical protein